MHSEDEDDDDDRESMMYEDEGMEDDYVKHDTELKDFVSQKKKVNSDVVIGTSTVETGKSLLSPSSAEEMKIQKDF